MFFLNFFSSFSASSLSNASSACSIIESTSPIPRILDAILSGWNSSISLSFSPVPTYLIGLPVTFLTDIAAPPRASPSSLVSITPSIPKSSLNLLATFTASWPVIESTTSKISCGLTFDLMSFSSCINVSSIWSLPAVSSITMSFNLLIAISLACLAIFTTFFSDSFAYTGMFSCAPTTWSCFIAAGLYTSQATSNGFLPCFRKRLASLPAVVVLPEPWRPTSIMTVGGFGEIAILLSVPPKSSTNSSFTIFTTCWPGVRDLSTSCPKALSWIEFINSFTTL